MLKLNIHNFKCFQDIEIPLNNLTVFTGANGNGKSTVIQALLFLRRTIEHCAIWENGVFKLNMLNGLNVELNGPYCLNLGNSNYVLASDSKTETISLGLKESDNKFQVTYGIGNGNELWLTPIDPLVDQFENSPLHLQEFYYLNAERIGPRLSQSIKFYDYYNVGYKGEYTAQIISNLNYQFDIDENRINTQNLKGSRFEHHVNAWLDFILPGISITSHYDDKTHTARLEMGNNLLNSAIAVPTNTGFGISYVLPIIVSGLIAKKDRILIIENPEAHLHPSAQSKIGYFLARIAHSGVKVFIETHSDHVVNGIQLSVAKNEINSNDVSINYFSNTIDSKQPVINTISISEKGELSEWPIGFFDQSQQDFAELFKLRRG